MDEWLRSFNQERPHLGRYCDGKTPMQTFREAKHLADEKMLDRQMPLWVGVRYEGLTDNRLELVQLSE